MFASQGRGNAALRRSHLGLGHLPIFHHPSLQPFADQADHAAVADPMLDETAELCQRRLECAHQVSLQVWLLEKRHLSQRVGQTR